MTRLYPMAQIINQWPHRSYFDHIFTGTVGMFQSSEDIVEEVANGLHNLVPEGLLNYSYLLQWHKINWA